MQPCSSRTWAGGAESSLVPPPPPPLPPRRLPPTAGTEPPLSASVLRVVQERNEPALHPTAASSPASAPMGSAALLESTDTGILQRGAARLRAKSFYEGKKRLNGESSSESVSTGQRTQDECSSSVRIPPPSLRPSLLRPPELCLRCYAAP